MLSVKIFDTRGSEDTLLIKRENSRSLHLSVNGTVSNDLFHHFLFCAITVAFSNEIGVLDFRMWLTMFIVGAFITLGLTNIWCTILCHHIAILLHKSMEEWPATIATFIHIIAGHEVLGRELWHFLSILDLHSIFCNLSE